MTNENPPKVIEEGQASKNSNEPFSYERLGRTLFGWTEAKATPLIIFIVLGISGLALALVDLAHIRHDGFVIENTIGFYALAGFAAFAFAVLSGWPLGKALRRDENFYGDDADDETGYESGSKGED